MMTENRSTSSSNTPGAWRPILLIVAVAVMLVLAPLLEIGEKLGALRGWIDSLGPWGPVVFVLLYVLAVVAALPGSAITVAAGALFGSVVGVLTVSVGSTVGAALPFLIARYFARSAAESWLGGNPKFRGFDELTERHGAAIVALTRLVPLFPFNLLNYGFGLTRVPFRTYVVGSWLCMLPATVLYVVGADVLTSGLSQGRVPWELLAVLAVVVVSLALLVRQARRRLEPGKPDPTAESAES